MDAKKKRKIKRLMGLIVPILVLVVTASVVGASFAWFSDSTSASVATIDLSVADIFTLQFSTDASQPTNNPYYGQTGVLGINPADNFAIDPANGGYLITNDRAESLGLAQNITYMQDKAYTFETRVHFDTAPDRFTDGIELAVSFDELQIGFMLDDDTLDPDKPSIVISSTAEHSDIDDIRYGFTWYIYKEGDNKIYSPYGYGTGAGANTPNPMWAGTPIEQNIPSFKASIADTYRFVIVFCPEKLYWMQYSTNDKDKSFNQVYPNNEYAEGTGADYIRGTLGYNNDIFQGATFNFTVKFERVE